MVGLGTAFRGTTVDSPGWVALGGWLGGCPQPCNDYSFAAWKGLFTLLGRVGLLSWNCWLARVDWTYARPLGNLVMKSPAL